MLSYDPVRVVEAARAHGLSIRPKVGGFPYLAASLRSAGIRSVHCEVGSVSTVYRLPGGAVIDQQAPLTNGLEAIAAFDVDAVVAAIRRDQRGESTYPEFMADIWRAGVVSYDVDLEARTCTYRGSDSDIDPYVEEYADVALDRLDLDVDVDVDVDVVR